MSVDIRSRMTKDVRDLTFEAVVDEVLPSAIAIHGDLAARGLAYQQLPPLGIEVTGAGTGITLAAAGNAMTVRSGTADAGIVAVMSEDACSDLIQDVQSTMGLAMTARMNLTSGNINQWIGWEPVLRALLNGRKVHETGDVSCVDLDGQPLDVTQTFSLHDDREVMTNFIEQAGFLHLRNVFDEREMAAVANDIDTWIARATPDDGASWWGEDRDGNAQAVRVLFFYDKSEALRELLADERFQWIANLTGDTHQQPRGAEGLVKPLGIAKGLSDLPWHKDCGQGKHSYYCNTLTCGISVTGADRTSGALGVIPGSHRANTMATGRDPKLDLQPIKLETNTGDITVHCSDTLHRAHPPTEQPRKVVYTDFKLAPMPDDIVDTDPRYNREARAELNNVQDRIAASDNPHDERAYRASRV